MANADFAAECDRRRSEGLILTGNTFPVKDKIKALGGIWDGQRKAWLMPNADKLAKAKALLPSSNTASNSRSSSYSRPRRWAPCGYPGCSPHYCDECDGEGMYGRGRY